MTTDVAIGNLALIECGEPLIASLNDDNKPARLLRASFEPTVLEILRHHPWRCCRTKVILAPDPLAAPAFGFDYACALPADFCGTYMVGNRIDKYEIVGKHLFTDDNAPEFTYTARKATSYFDHMLVTAISARLAWRICIALTDSATRRKEIREAAVMSIADAKFADSMDGAPEDAPMGRWAQARLAE